MLTRHGLQEYISDCVIALDHRVVDSVSTRRLRVVKYRGSTHGANEYPFLIDEDGFSILPLTSLELKHPAFDQRIPTGISELDDMLGGAGYFKGSSVLISGTAGTGKTTVAATFVDAACARGERCIYFSFEESQEQVLRNMLSVGLDLRRWTEKGLLTFYATRPTTFGLETHLVRMHRLIRDFSPEVVVVDPITAILKSGPRYEAGSMLLRMIDHLKANGITALLTTLTNASSTLEETSVDISSLSDCWLLLRDIEIGGERNRGLYVLKARGIPHSNQIREFFITKKGVHLRQIYLGEAGLVTGSSRVSKEAEEASKALVRQQEVERRILTIQRKRKMLEAQMAMLELEVETQAVEEEQLISHAGVVSKKLEADLGATARSRSARASGEKAEDLR